MIDRDRGNENHGPNARDETKDQQNGDNAMYTRSDVVGQLGTATSAKASPPTW